MAPKPSRKKKRVRDEDTELIEAINAGASDRFHELFEKYGCKLYNFGLRMCADPQDAEDMVQDTFLNAFRYLGGFRYETKFRNWLYRVAATVCIKKRRRSKFAPDEELALEDLMPAHHGVGADGIPQWAAEPLERLLNEELFDCVENAILKLPEPYRLVFVLRDLEGFSTAETAQMLELSPANVKVRLHRARFFIRQRLSEYFEDEQP
jgi:RNA polymerase sigma-70 factor (ECF subfamily)